MSMRMTTPAEHAAVTIAPSVIPSERAAGYLGLLMVPSCVMISTFSSSPAFQGMSKATGSANPEMTPLRWPPMPQLAKPVHWSEVPEKSKISFSPVLVMVHSVS